MINTDREIIVKKVENTRKITDPIIPPSPEIVVDKPVQTTKITNTEKIQSLESIISSLKTSIDNLERLIDG